MTLISATLPDSSKSWSACWRAHGLLALVYQRILAVATERGEDVHVALETHDGVTWATATTEGAPRWERVDVSIKSADGRLNWLSEQCAPDCDLDFSECAIAESALRVLPDLRLELVTKDATLSHFVRKPVWISADGYLAMSHPTDPRGGEIGAPKDGRYEPVTDPEEEERSYEEYVRQQDARFHAA